MATKHYGAAPSADLDLVRLQDIWGYSDAWSTYTPTWTQSATISKTINKASYVQIGKTVIVSVDLSATSAGTASNAMQVSLPVTPAASVGTFANIGTWHYNDNGTAFYGGSVRYVGSNLIQFLVSASSTAGFGANPAVTTASGDEMTFTAIYEAASGFGGLAFPPAGGWQTYTPTLVQSGAVTKTVTYASYTQIGRFVAAEVTLQATGAGSANNEVRIGLPVAAAQTAISIGNGTIFDQSAGLSYRGFAITDSVNYVTLYESSGTGVGRLGATGTAFTAAMASGDQVTITVFYEAATTGGIPAPMTWTDWTPTLTQSATVTKTVSQARYIQTGKTVNFNATLTVTGSGTASNNVVVGLPVPSSTAGIVAYGSIFDSSASARYQFIAFINTPNDLLLAGTTTTSAGFLGSTTFTAGLASGDVIQINGTYEAA